jgi:polar amino acid transport system ATP-binding protein
MEPDIMLFDEPTSALDPTMAREILGVIRKLTKLGLTMVIVTHEMQFAREIAGRIFYMDDHGIYEEGSPDEIFLHPKRPRTKSFIQKLKTLNFRIQSHQFDMVAMNAEIETFCERCGISLAKVNHIELVLEELLVRILNRCYSGGKPEIECHIGFSDERDAVSIHLTFRAHKFDPLVYDPEDLEDLGLLLVDRITEEKQHQFTDGMNDLLLRL